MRRSITTLAGVVFLALLISFSIKGSSQTSGTLTFTVTTTSHTGQYGSDHVVAVWLEYANGAFLKTKLRRANTNHTINNHLPVWKANNPHKNVIDATTAATLTTYTTPITITWNATDTNAALVPDGVIRVLIEESWEEGASGRDTTSVKFIKGTSAVHLTPANTANFTSMVLDWNPTATAVQDNKQDPNIIVYPTISTGLVNIDFEQNNAGTLIQVVNINGQKVFEEKVIQGSTEQKTIDLSNCANGMYFVRIRKDIEDKVYQYKIVLEK
jgi:hypothetical protein